MSLVDVSFLVDRDLLVYTATFQHVGNKWRLRAIRETMQALLAMDRRDWQVTDTRESIGRHYISLGVSRAIELFRKGVVGFLSARLESLSACAANLGHIRSVGLVDSPKHIGFGGQRAEPQHEWFLSARSVVFPISISAARVHSWTTRGRARTKRLGRIK